jgi:molybdopterin/thiamine biosynthesis adenylyltransferase
LSKSSPTGNDISKSATSGRAARHIALTQIGLTGQQRIESSSVLLIGLGGIGCAVASYLASSGVGHLLLSDFDTVDATNLGRQFLYGPADLGSPKVQIAASRLASFNPDVQLTEIGERLSGAALMEVVSRADVVLDGCDNFATRFQVNDACVEQGKCLISGSAIRFEGQLAVFGPDYANAACYRCLYREADESLENCSGNGVLSSVPGVIGTMMATEALKYLAGLAVKTCSLNLYDAMSTEWRTVTVRKRTGCVCA